VIDLRAMLLAELDDFVTRYRPCGQLTGDAAEPTPKGYMLSVVCSCGVTLSQWVTPDAAAHDLHLPMHGAEHSLMS